MCVSVCLCVYVCMCVCVCVCVCVCEHVNPAIWGTLNNDTQEGLYSVFLAGSIIIFPL